MEPQSVRQIPAVSLGHRPPVFHRAPLLVRSPGALGQIAARPESPRSQNPTARTFQSCLHQYATLIGLLIKR